MLFNKLLLELFKVDSFNSQDRLSTAVVANEPWNRSGFKVQWLTMLHVHCMLAVALFCASSLHLEPSVTQKLLLLILPCQWEMGGKVKWPDYMIIFITFIDIHMSLLSLFHWPKYQWWLCSWALCKCGKWSKSSADWIPLNESSFPFL